MGGLALNVVRRKRFELFYYSHYAFMFIIMAVLWHAASAWYFILPGLSLWILDRMLRFYRGTRAVKVIGFEPYGDFTKISFVIPGFQFKSGQYVFVNVPDVSVLQWHPFSISTSPHDPIITLHCGVQGPGSFTAHLLEVARKGTIPHVCIDGPYGGESCDFSQYDAVILFAGGIGITPCNSLFRSLCSEGRPVHLIWAMREASLLRIFPDLMSRLSNHDDYSNTSVRLYLTSKGHYGVADDEPLHYYEGRPNFHEELARLSNTINLRRTLVFACGPMALLDSAYQAAVAWGASYHSETFEL